MNLQRLLYSEEEKGSKTRNGDEPREEERCKENVMVMYLYSKARFVMVHYLA